MGHSLLSRFGFLLVFLDLRHEVVDGRGGVEDLGWVVLVAALDCSGVAQCRNHRFKHLEVGLPVSVAHLADVVRQVCFQLFSIPLPWPVTCTCLLREM